MKKFWLPISTGLALFSMFFGSGNLVFPLVVGKLSAGHLLTGFGGFFLTGVVVPFLAVFALFLFRGDTQAFFGRLGKHATFLFPLIALSLMGPFGVLARCITVAHGSWRLLLPETPLWLFSLIGCAVLFFCTFKKRKIIPLLGAVLTPVLLVSLLAIWVFHFFSPGSAAPTMEVGGVWSDFWTGISQGYQTMDLLAAFFFSAFVIQHLQKKEEKRSLTIFLQSSLVGAFLLSLVYLALTSLGSSFASLLVDVPYEEMLGVIAQATLGPMAAPIVATAVILACLTTAVVLTSLFADFLQKRISQERISHSLSLGATLLIAFSVSLLGFTKIAEYLGAVLTAIYPALIVFTVLAIFHKLWGWRSIKVPFATAVVLKIFLFS